MDSPGTLPARWRTLAAAWDPSEGRRGDVARAAIFRLCAEELEASIAGDSLAEALESERLRRALERAEKRCTEGGICDLCGELMEDEEGGEGIDLHDADCPFAALSRSPADPTPLRRLLAALTRFESVMGSDGGEVEAAMDELRAAGREVLGAMGGEVPG